MWWMVLLGCTSPSEGLLGLNEIGPTATDDQSEVAPFAEVFNADDTAASLEGWSIEHDGETWTVGAVDVPAGGITLLWLDGEPNQGATHAPMALATAGGPIDVYDADGELVQAIEVPELDPQMSFGRKPDGAANWQVIADPSPGDLNGE